jgi:hypothetical protein
MRVVESNRRGIVLSSFIVLAASCAGCGSMTAGDPVHVVRASSDVASCRKVGDVAVDRRVQDHDVLPEVAEQARKLGGNTVLMESGARSGSAYRCDGPGSEKR